MSSAIDFSVGICNKLVNPAIKHHTIPNRSIWCCYNTNHTQLAVIVGFTTLVGTVVSHPLTPNCTRRCHAFTWTAPMLASTGSASLPSPSGMSIRFVACSVDSQTYWIAGQILEQQDIEKCWRSLYRTLYPIYPNIWHFPGKWLACMAVNFCKVIPQSKMATARLQVSCMKSGPITLNPDSCKR